MKISRPLDLVLVAVYKKSEYLGGKKRTVFVIVYFYVQKTERRKEKERLFLSFSFLFCRMDMRVFPRIN